MFPVYVVVFGSHFQILVWVVHSVVRYMTGDGITIYRCNGLTEFRCKTDQSTNIYEVETETHTWEEVEMGG